MRNFLILCAVLAGLVTWTTIAGSKPNAKVTLTFIWHAGDRANLFQKIAWQYTTETGVEIKALLPPMTSDFVALFKDTSVASVIAVRELQKRYQVLVTDPPNYDYVVEIAVLTALLAALATNREELPILFLACRNLAARLEP